MMNNTAPPAAPAIIGMGNPPLELPSAEASVSKSTQLSNDTILQYTSDSTYLPVTQLKDPPTFLHFTEVPSSFTSSHTCSPLPLTL